MPVEMHNFYLRTMYHENRLAKPGGISLAGVPIDLTRITTPTFMVSTREDHIAPWRSTYAATRLYRGPIKFVLAESGHIAGIINPPAALTVTGTTRSFPNVRNNGSKAPSSWRPRGGRCGKNGLRNIPAVQSPPENRAHKAWSRLRTRRARTFGSALVRRHSDFDQQAGCSFIA